MLISYSWKCKILYDSKTSVRNWHDQTTQSRQYFRVDCISLHCRTKGVDYHNFVALLRDRKENWFITDLIQCTIRKNNYSNYTSVLYKFTQTKLLFVPNTMP